MNGVGGGSRFVDSETFASRVLALSPEKKRDLAKRNLEYTLGDTSLDDKHEELMVESDLNAVNFDGLVGAICFAAPYNVSLRKPIVPCAPDALVISDRDRRWHLIEFKNGRVDEMQVIRKMYDSVLLAVDLGIVPDRSYFNEFASFILVYNPDRLSESQKGKEDKDRRNKTAQIPKNRRAELIRTQAYLKERAGQDLDPFGITKLKGYLFDEVIVQTQRRFIDTHDEWKVRQPERRLDPGSLDAQPQP
ncbi:hypothetical protein JS533_013480 [Bifidobacterium amazonense]|uniref:Uncharacterized protein n=1 Tax=Bifidobacterium amazonense TaxID=2809027 RepID=A0ABS9VYS4_9BIFI|nr:hypothetical protein [Bifidobacterium amazonense]MCH9277260.1 hypothetical protein [Bifidobacterium amazonense]